MLTTSSHRGARWLGLAGLALALAAPTAWAVQPTVKTVPWVATNPLIPHDTYTGRSIRLKGTADVQGANFQYTWDFGDGSAVATGTVGNMYAIEAAHAYTGAAGTTYTARLTVRDANTGESDSEVYLVTMQDRTLEVEVNVAIDEGLWYLHKTQRRYDSSSMPFGDWVSGGNASQGYLANTAVNLNAFFVHGHLETGAASNPYTETVQRGMRYLFTRLSAFGIGNQTYPAPVGAGICAPIGSPPTSYSCNPDGNGNGLGIQVNDSYPPYQGGSIMDAIVASGTPSKLTTTGPGNIVGRTYKDIVQDMVDGYAYCQGDAGAYFGGWRYSCNYGGDSDNSTNQWAAIGLIAAERGFGITVPQWVKDANVNSVKRTQDGNSGHFGYTNSTGTVWGPYAVTPSGMVQMTLDGIGRGDQFLATDPIAPNRTPWELAETYMRNSYCNGGGAGSTVRSYYYGWFSFTKAMLLHDPNGDKVADPIECLTSRTAGVAPIDWYGAQAGQPDTQCNAGAAAQCDGVARTLINAQNAAGYWYGHNMDGSQYPFETAWALIMLNEAVFESGKPVAVAQAVPNPAVVGQTITLDGSASFHQDPTRIIDSWAWDLNNDGTIDASGPFVTTSFPALGSYTVRLVVTDNGAPELTDDTTLVVVVSIPPLAPTANADGPYVFCPNRTPWFLDGTASVNPDEGNSEPGRPGDTIQSYLWDLDGDGQFDDASGAQPNVTAFFQARGVGDYLVQLQVTDTTATSFPSSGSPNLSDTDSAQVSVKTAQDPACLSCISNLLARPKLSKIQLTWSPMAGTHHYNVYRSTVNGGPYLKIGSTTSTYSTYLDGGPLALGVTYYYVVRPAAINDTELCQSNQASARVTTR